ncbi:MAG TPA: nucleic acid-binding protein, partial [Thermoplasmatales archaeon]|nr:nucleic acid-binding protein [Thermoplasmatales archaeon]HEX16878.1 nucleic acid-binding protein [Thermoplasmatales archaeon]
MNIYIIDSSAILSGKPISLDGKIVIPESVRDEVMREDPKLLELIQGNVTMESPSRESLLLVKEAAERL